VKQEKYGSSYSDTKLITSYLEERMSKYRVHCSMAMATNPPRAKQHPTCGRKFQKALKLLQIQKF